MYFHGFTNGGILLLLGFIVTAGAMVLWFRDVIMEGTSTTPKLGKNQNNLNFAFIKNVFRLLQPYALVNFILLYVCQAAAQHQILNFLHTQILFLQTQKH